jgi:hypothetical protein
MTCYLYTVADLPNGFRFPDSFLRAVSTNPMPDIDPWWFLCEFKDSADFWLAELKRQYPDRSLVPFAKLGAFDDIACFDGADKTGDPVVFYVHSFASPGWEDRGFLPNFSDWLKAAPETTIEVGPGNHEGG